MKYCLAKPLLITLSGLLVVDMTFADTWSSLGADQKAPVPTESHSGSNKQATPVNGAVAQMLFSDIELLKKEIQKLQGVVEEQGYELNKLKMEQKERYLDLDRRLSQVVTKSPDASADGTIKNNEKDQYKIAFDLMKEQKLDEAVLAFSEFLQNTPKDPLAVNGYYWLGQIYYNQSKLDDARKAFTIVVNQFPNHQKAADSMYKLGVVLDRLGDSSQSEKYLKLVIKKFPDSTTASFAKKYLKENMTK